MPAGTTPPAPEPPRRFSALSLFRAGSTFLDAYRLRCREIAARVGRQLRKVEAGTELLSERHLTGPFELIHHVGNFSPWVMDRLAAGDTDVLAAYQDVLGEGVVATNLCASHENLPCLETPVRNGTEVYDCVVDLMLRTRGAAVAGVEARAEPEPEPSGDRPDPAEVPAPLRTLFTASRAEFRPTGVVEVHTLVAHGHVPRYPFAVKSLARHWPEIAPVVHDDTLTAGDLRRLHCHMAGLRVIVRPKADKRVERLLAGHPLLTRMSYSLLDGRLVKRVRSPPSAPTTARPALLDPLHRGAGDRPLLRRPRDRHHLRPPQRGGGAVPGPKPP
ncbi:hypothetical protein [Streptomyces sp. NPDC013171]|uniref:hypothetical protein n=1 Tax=Streptomyces sp. NPDC013171 TaxID=3364863 RepID=UPI0036CB9CAE